MPVESGKLKLNLKGQHSQYICLIDLAVRHTVWHNIPPALSGGTPWVAKKKKKSKTKALDITAEPEAEGTEEADAVTQAGPTTTSKSLLAGNTNMFASSPSLTSDSFLLQLARSWIRQQCPCKVARPTSKSLLQR